MTRYGYKISGFAGSERYFEAERLLDIALKGFEKLPASFEEDGSRKQEYIRKDDEGERNVTLIKNVTESGILVFSDVQLRIFRFGGAVFYLWDILPTVLMGILWWFAVPKILRRLPMGNIPVAAVDIAAGLIFCFISMVICSWARRLEEKDHRHLRILFVPCRTRLRMEFIARGGIFTLIALFISGFRIFSGYDMMYLLALFLRSPIPILMISILPLLSKRRRR